jgi:hypothetical protein
MKLYKNFLKNKTQKIGLIKINHYLIFSNNPLSKELIKIGEDHDLNLMRFMLNENSIENVFKTQYYKKNKVLVENAMIKSSFLFKKPEILYDLNKEKYNKYYLSGYLSEDSDLKYTKSVDKIHFDSNEYILKYINYEKYIKSSEFFQNVIMNCNEERCVHLLKNYNIKLNTNYVQLILENLYKNKNDKLTSMYLSTPVFSFRKMFNDGNFLLESKRIINSLFLYIMDFHARKVMILLSICIAIKIIL